MGQGCTVFTKSQLLVAKFHAFVQMDRGQFLINVYLIVRMCSHHEAGHVVARFGPAFQMSLLKSLADAPKAMFQRVYLFHFIL